MFVEIGLCGAAGFLFLRGIYHSGVLTGWIAQGLSQPAPPTRPIAAKLTLPDPAIDDARWQAMFLATPSAFWLDPNLWGDNPGWRDDLPVKLTPPIVPRYRIVPVMPRCPNCETAAAVIVLTEHGGEATMWHCGHCMAEFTKKGETSKSRKANAAIREALALNDRMGATKPRLPCGCDGRGTTSRIRVGSGGGDSFRATECDRCHAWWEPPSNDPTGRLLAQGEKVHGADLPLDMPLPPAVD